MRIGIDARELCGRTTGVGRYLAGLLDEWASRDDTRHEFVLYAHRPLTNSLDNRRFLGRTVSGEGGTVWEQLHLSLAVRRDHLDVFFAPAYTTPLLAGVPTVVAIHDVSFMAHPEWFTTREGLRRRLLTRHAAQQARAVIAISEFSRREIVDRLGVPETRVHVIPPGLTALWSGHRDTVAEPKLLFVGSIFNRRHVPELIRAFAPVARSHADVSLDIIGDNRSHPREDLEQVIRTEGLLERVRWRHYVSDENLRALYASARAFAFLSEYEGLGLTPLEALAAGVPPLLLDTPIARECCGSAALYVPKDRTAITEGVEALLFDNDVRARLLAAAPAALARYQWSSAASQTLTVLERAVSSPLPEP
jgi:glycosyltransferase involved in cell wall biosynthesis